MFRKTLIATAVAGVLGCSAGAFADSGPDHTAFDSSAVSATQSADTISLGMDTTLSSLEGASAPVEIGDGLLASVVDDEFDGQGYAAGEGAIGSTSSAGGSGSVAFSSHAGASSTTNAPEGVSADSPAEEVYVVPAPLAHNDGSRFWRLEISPWDLQARERLQTENVYLMTPIEDAIVDPRVALTAGPDGVLAALNGEVDGSLVADLS